MEEIAHEMALSPSQLGESFGRFGIFSLSLDYAPNSHFSWSAKTVETVINRMGAKARVVMFGLVNGCTYVSFFAGPARKMDASGWAKVCAWPLGTS